MSLTTNLMYLDTEKQIPQECEKPLEILTDLIYRLHKKKSWVINRFSSELLRMSKRERQIIYLGIFNRREVNVLLCAYSEILRSLEGWSQVPRLEASHVWDYSSIAEIEEIISVAVGNKFKVSYQQGAAVKKHQFAAVGVERMPGNKDLETLLQENLFVILDTGLKHLYADLEKRIVGWRQEAGKDSRLVLCKNENIAQ